MKYYRREDIQVVLNENQQVGIAMLLFNFSQQLSTRQLLAHFPSVGWGGESEG